MAHLLDPSYTAAPVAVARGLYVAIDPGYRNMGVAIYDPDQRECVVKTVDWPGYLTQATKQRELVPLYHRAFSENLWAFHLLFDPLNTVFIEEPYVATGIRIGMHMWAFVHYIQTMRLLNGGGETFFVAPVSVAKRFRMQPESDARTPMRFRSRDSGEHGRKVRYVVKKAMAVERFREIQLTGAIPPTYAPPAENAGRKLGMPWKIVNENDATPDRKPDDACDAFLILVTGMLAHANDV